jgi:hypothetical protein
MSLHTIPVAPVAVAIVSGLPVETGFNSTNNYPLTA